MIDNVFGGTLNLAQSINLINPKPNVITDRVSTEGNSIGSVRPFVSTNV